MKLRWIVVVVMILFVCQASAAEEMTLKSEKDKVSYIIGREIGNNLKSQAIDVEPEILARGIKDAFSGAKPIMTEEEMREVMTAFQKEVMAKRQ